MLREQKSIKRVLQEVLKEVLHEVFNGRKWPTTYLQKMLRELLYDVQSAPRGVTGGVSWQPVRTTYLATVRGEGLLQDALF